MIHLVVGEQAGFGRRLHMPYDGPLAALGHRRDKALRIVALRAQKGVGEKALAGVDYLHRVGHRKARIARRQLLYIHLVGPKGCAHRCRSLIIFFHNGTQPHAGEVENLLRRRARRRIVNYRITGRAIRRRRSHAEEPRPRYAAVVFGRYARGACPSNLRGRRAADEQQVGYAGVRHIFARQAAVRSTA